eukprot:1145668-Pelagomonas_calceolata.AAC.1
MAVGMCKHTSTQSIEEQHSRRQASKEDAVKNPLRTSLSRYVLANTPRSNLRHAEQNLDTQNATKLALKLHAYSVQYAYKPAPDAFLTIFLSTLITKIRQEALLVTLLIPIDIFLFSLGEGDPQCLGPSHGSCVSRLVVCVRVCVCNADLACQPRITGMAK